MGVTLEREPCTRIERRRSDSGGTERRRTGGTEIGTREESTKNREGAREKQKVEERGREERERERSRRQKIEGQTRERERQRVKERNTETEGKGDRDSKGQTVK